MGLQVRGVPRWLEEAGSRRGGREGFLSVNHRKFDVSLKEGGICSRVGGGRRERGGRSWEGEGMRIEGGRKREEGWRREGRRRREGTRRRELGRGRRRGRGRS